MTLVALVVPIFTGESYKMYPEDYKHEGDHEMQQPRHAICENWWGALGFTVLKYIIMIGLYVGVCLVIFGTVNYEPPRGSWPYDEIPPPSPAVVCTMILTSVYFLVYAFIQACKTLDLFLPVLRVCAQGSGSAGKRCVHHGLRAHAVGPLHRRPHARVDDGSSPRAAAAVGAELLLYVHLRSDGTVPGRHR